MGSIYLDKMMNKTRDDFAAIRQKRQILMDPRTKCATQPQLRIGEAMENAFPRGICSSPPSLDEEMNARCILGVN